MKWELGYLFLVDRLSSLIQSQPKGLEVIQLELKPKRSRGPAIVVKNIIKEMTFKLP